SYMRAAFNTITAPLSAARTEDETRENHSRHLRIAVLLIEAVSQVAQSYLLCGEERSPLPGIWIATVAARTTATPKSCSQPSDSLRKTAANPIAKSGSRQLVTTARVGSRRRRPPR